MIRRNIFYSRSDENLPIISDFPASFFPSSFWLHIYPRPLFFPAAGGGDSGGIVNQLPFVGRSALNGLITLSERRTSTGQGKKSLERSLRPKALTLGRTGKPYKGIISAAICTGGRLLAFHPGGRPGPSSEWELCYDMRPLATELLLARRGRHPSTAGEIKGISNCCKDGHVALFPNSFTSKYTETKIPVAVHVLASNETGPDEATQLAS